MQAEWLISKIEGAANSKLSDKQRADISKLVDMHNAGECNVHQHTKLLITQCSIGLQDLYDRYIRIKTELTPKDSASYKSFEIRYGHLAQQYYEDKCKKAVQSLDSFIKKYGDDGPRRYEEYKISKSMSLEGFVKRHGAIEGEIQWRKYWDTTNFGTSEKHFIARHGEVDGPIKFAEFKKSQQSATTLESYIEKYGEAEGIRLYKQRAKKKSVNSSKEYMVNKMLNDGHSLIDIFSAIDTRWNQTSKDAFIRKYGEIDGPIKYAEYIEAHKKNNIICMEYYTSRGIDEHTAKRVMSSIQKERAIKSGGCVSKESILYLQPIMSIIKNSLACDILFGTSKNEFKILLNDDERQLSNNGFFQYDFTVPSLKLIVEYNGAKYHDSTLDLSSTLNMDMSDFKCNFNSELFKKWVAENRGFTVITLRSLHLDEDELVLFDFLKKHGVNM